MAMPVLQSRETKYDCKQWQCSCDCGTSGSSVRDLKDTVIAIEKIVQLLPDKYDTVLAGLNRNDKEIKDIKCRIEEGRECQCKEQLTDFKRDIDELEWQHKKLIPKTDHEVLLKKVIAVASPLKLPSLEECDVTAMYRLPARSDRIPGVIVRFCRQSVRNKWFERHRQPRSHDSTVYVQDNLTNRQDL